VTRADLIVLALKHYPRRLELHWRSDADPKGVRPFLRWLAGQQDWPSLDEFQDRNPAGSLCFGRVGYPYYIYEVDLGESSYRGWFTKSRWQRAPVDWRARGWVCRPNDRGVVGYPLWVKDKLVDWSAQENQ